MQYFVSIEKKSYFYWQIELLIYSFKRYSMEDQLVIAIADTDQPSAIPRNLSKCNYFLHKNYGKEYGYLQMNKPLSILEAKSRGILRNPFVILEPDMVLFEPIQEIFKEDVFGNYTQYLELDALQKDHKSYYDFLSPFHNKWKPAGPIFVVNKDNDDLYKKVVDNCVNMIKNNKDFWWPLDMLAWIMSFLEFNLKLNCKKIEPTNNPRSDVYLESYIYSNYNSNFLHYCHYPADNFFHKYKYKDIKPGTLAIEPFVDILKIDSNYSLSASILQEITRDFLIDYGFTV